MACPEQTGRPVLASIVHDLVVRQHESTGTSARQMKPATNRTRQNDPEGFRARVLDVAAGLFQVNGYHATSIKDVMQAASASGGALHHHFPTKKQLALAVIRDRVAPAVRDTWIEPVRRAPSLGKGITAVFEAIAAGLAARESVAGCPLNNLALELSLSEPELRGAINEIFGEWQSILAQRIGETGGGARLDRAKRLEAAAFIVAVYSGAMTLAKSAQSAAPLRNAAGVLARWLRERDFAQ
jgi:TetR/AcrR family transcriptional repressor of nem operon